MGHLGASVRPNPPLTTSVNSHSCILGLYRPWCPMGFSKLSFQLVWPEYYWRGTFRDVSRTTPQLKMCISTHSRVQGTVYWVTEGFVSSLYGVAGTGISVPLSHPLHHLPRQSVAIQVFWEYAERSPKDYMKSSFHVVQPSCGEAFRRVFQTNFTPYHVCQ